MSNYRVPSSVFADDRPTRLIGMVHAGALPGTPWSDSDVRALTEQAVGEAKILAETGFDAIIVENMHDAPYVHGSELGPEITAAMTRIVGAVVEAMEIPVGIQILSGGNRHALAVAYATGARFIRCENFVFAHVADEGLLERAEAGTLLRYRKSIGADDIEIFCDIKKKHASHALTSDLSIADIAEGASFFGADGLIVTGVATGHPTDAEDVKAAKEAAALPVLVGSGVTPESGPKLLEHADALIVGSWIKGDGFWKNPVDPDRAHEMVQAVRG